ncbi:DUF411 domain-containing protein [Parendozoicomonas haliclonae]|nr:DUF411 domain-containing protein [Parendozoicomonas haliclonae]
MTAKTRLAGLMMTLSFSSATLAQDLPVVEVFKSASCGCCGKWVDHLKENGFEVVAKNVDNVNIYKQQAKLPYGLGSCHTAFVNGYALEGHVPASDVLKLLAEKPAIKGLTVPGMPIGSPGMEMGDRKDAFQTLAYTEQGKVTVFTSH